MAQSIQQSIEQLVSKECKSIDDDLKIALYDASKSDFGSAQVVMERMRKKLKLLEGNSKAAIKVTKGRLLAANKGQVKFLKEENSKLKKEIKDLKMQLSFYSEDDSELSSYTLEPSQEVTGDAKHSSQESGQMEPSQEPSEEAQHSSQDLFQMESSQEPSEEAQSSS